MVPFLPLVPDTSICENILYLDLCGQRQHRGPVLSVAGRSLTAEGSVMR